MCALCVGRSTNIQPTIAAAAAAGTQARPTALLECLNSTQTHTQPAQDVSCNGAAFCKVCGGVDEVRKACLGQARCVAFTYDAASSCGYLKSGIDAAKGRSGWVAYTR